MVIVFNLYPFWEDLYLPNAYLVSTDHQGMPTHIVQKATRETLASHGIPVDETLGNQLSLVESLQPKSVEARFKPTKSRHTPALAYLLDDQQTRPTVMRYLHEQLDRFLKLIVQQRSLLALELDRHALVHTVLLALPAEDQVPHISFRKTESGVEYRLQIGSETQKWSISGTDISPLTNTDPAWLLAGHALLRVPGINGNMVKPFRAKDVVHIPPDKVQAYFRQFVAKAAGRTVVEAEGFDMQVTRQLRAVRLEPVEHLLENKWYFKPVFVYDGASFAWSDKREQVTAVHFDEAGNAALQQVRRDTDAEAEKIAALADLGLRADGRLLATAGSGDLPSALAWAAQNQQTLLQRAVEPAPFQVDGRSVALVIPKLALQVQALDDWFDVRGHVQAGEYRFPFNALVPCLRKADPYFPLPDGTFFRIPEEWFARYADLAAETEAEGAEGLRLRKSLFTLLEKAGLQPDGDKAFPVVDPELVDFTPPATLQATLRPYQLSGVKWLVGHHREGFGACLADDMGLGKTLQTIAFLLYLKAVAATSVAEKPTKSATSVAESSTKSVAEVAESLTKSATEVAESLNKSAAEVAESSNKSATEVADSAAKAAGTGALVILPASLVFNWQRELQRFAPSLFVYVHTGPKRLKDRRAICAHDVVLTTYHTARQDLKLIGDIEWRAIVLDESQYIKNRSSEISKVVRSLKGGFRVSLSGTPIENSLADLWTQMEFINPDTLGSYADFRAQFQLPIEKKGDAQAQQRLLERVRPFFMRRTKEEVAPDLPALTEQIFYTEMAPEQHKLYEKIKSAARNEILSLFDDPKTRLQALQALTRLRQLANHPVLTDQDYRGDSGKFTDVTAQWEVVRRANHKVLFFSSFVKHLNIFKQAFDEAGYSYAWLTGDTPAPERAAAVQRFQENADVQAFFMTVKAGGVGLNLTAADYVFVLDPWWNPAAENQAIARAHRIGQTKPVTALRFISRGSIEEKIVLLQERKRALGVALFADGVDTPSLSREDLELLLM